MKTIIAIESDKYTINLEQPLDISLALRPSSAAANAWYCSPVSIDPVITENFVGAVSQGGSVNFNDIRFNPHGNGTHTECVGHISKEFYSINQLLDNFFFLSQLISISPKKESNDAIITLQQIQELFDNKKQVKALLIRTLPNKDAKKTKQYTNSNPPFVEAEAMNWLYLQGIRHFMIDTPSVDKEIDGGKLAAHHAYWNYPNKPRLDATITELIYVPNKIKDGFYMLNLQVAALENDASPSRPVLYGIEEGI